MSVWEASAGDPAAAAGGAPGGGAAQRAHGATSPLAAPFRIGSVDIPNRVVLAPMAGLSTTAYRRHMKAHGAGLVFTEMVSAHGLVHHNVRTGEYLDFADEERPLAVQLFADDPEVMARAAEVVLSRPMVPDLIDINMGCPVRKVVKTGAGCALMGDFQRAVAVAAAVVAVAAQAGVPVTVKLRSGLTPGDGLAEALAPRLEAAGVQALGLHPRAANEYYKGTADHSITAAVVRAVSIPVMASGDVKSGAAALGIFETTGAAAMMVARSAAGNPWLVGELLTGRRAPRPPLPEVVADLRLLLAPSGRRAWPRAGRSLDDQAAGLVPAALGRTCAGDRTAADAARRRGAGPQAGEAVCLMSLSSPTMWTRLGVHFLRERRGGSLGQKE